MSESYRRLSEFNAWVTILANESHPVTALCQHFHMSRVSISSIEGKLYHLFVRISLLGEQAYKAGQQERAGFILQALVAGLNRHPKLYDGRKRDMLLHIATIFKTWSGEDILRQMIMTCDGSLPTPKDDPCQLLSESLHETSEIIKQSLRTFWNKEDTSPIPPNLALPSLSRAAQHPNMRVILATLLPETSISQTMPTEHVMQSIANAFDWNTQQQFHKFGLPLTSVTSMAVHPCFMLLLRAVRIVAGLCFRPRPILIVETCMATQSSKRRSKQVISTSFGSSSRPAVKSIQISWLCIIPPSSSNFSASKSLKPCLAKEQELTTKDLLTGNLPWTLQWRSAGRSFRPAATVFCWTGFNTRLRNLSYGPFSRL